MKSLQVLNCIPEDWQSGYSDLQVMKSAAGWYVGTTYTKTEKDGTVISQPGSRDTPYTGRQKTAELWLIVMEEIDKENSDKGILDKVVEINETIGGDFQYRLYP